MVEYLVNECGKDPRQDAEYSGYVKAIRDFRHVTLDEIKEA